MIQAKEDYLRYLKSDKKSLAKKHNFPLPIGDEIWIFQRLLRKIEYIQNCKGRLYLPYLYFLKFKFRLMSIRLGYSIPIMRCIHLASQRIQFCNSQTQENIHSQFNTSSVLFLYCRYRFVVFFLPILLVIVKSH